VYPAAQPEHDPITTEEFNFPRIGSGDVNEISIQALAYLRLLLVRTEIAVLP
jgi:hypothetical protein